MVGFEVQETTLYSSSTSAMRIFGRSSKIKVGWFLYKCLTEQEWSSTTSPNLKPPNCGSIPATVDGQHPHDPIYLSPGNYGRIVYFLGSRRIVSLNRSYVNRAHLKSVRTATQPGQLDLALEHHEPMRRDEQGPI